MMAKMKWVITLLLLLVMAFPAYAGTRAIQIETLMDGVRDPDDDQPMNGGTAYFYAAGTSTPKNVWTEKEKTNAYTSYTLGADGSIQLYGDGLYKIVVKDSAGNTEYTWDNVKIQANTFSVSTQNGTYTATPDDDVLLCNGTFTVNLQTVDDFEHPVVIKNIGSGTITVDPNGAETIDGSTTLTITAQNKTLTLYPDTTASTWRRGYVQSNIIADADEDTKIQTEESADEDVIRFDIAGTEQVIIADGKIEPTTDDDIDLGSASKEFKDGYFDGTVNADAADVSGAVDIGAGTTRRVAPAGTFVNNANENPNISDTIFEIDQNVTHQTWESVGCSTCSPDNQWAAMDSVPDDADWIEVRIMGGCNDTSASAVQEFGYLRARQEGGDDDSAGPDNTIAFWGDVGTAAGDDALIYWMNTAKIPISSVGFDIYWDTTFGTDGAGCSIDLILTGWGFNP